jgi:hypothetical protein
MRCDYCDTQTELVNEWYEVTCEQCQFEHYVMNSLIDSTPANDGKQSHVFITMMQANEILQLTLDEAKAFLKNLQTGIRVAEEMENRNEH